MTQSEKHTKDKSVGTPIWLACERCQGETRHTVVSSVDVSDSSPDGDILVWQAFQVVECAGCRWLSFRHQSSSTEDLGADGAPIEHAEVYPRRNPKVKPLEHEYYLPDKVRHIYREAHYALRNDLPILAGIGIRALVEAVCSAENATGGSLQQRIDSLATIGKLTRDGARILHGTRLLGNRAAHEVDPPDQDDLIAAMQVAEGLLQTVYILPRLADRLPK